MPFLAARCTHLGDSSRSEIFYAVVFTVVVQFGTVLVGKLLVYHHLLLPGRILRVLK